VGNVSKTFLFLFTADKMLQNRIQIDERGEIADGTTAADQKKSSKKLFYMRVFIAQWVFLLASAVFGYFFVGEAVQGKIY
jgi:hypothetical protein